MTTVEATVSSWFFVEFVLIHTQRCLHVTYFNGFIGIIQIIGKFFCVIFNQLLV